MTSSNGNILRVTGPLWGESTGDQWIPSQRPMTQRSNVFFDLHLNERLSKQSKCSYYDVIVMGLWQHFQLLYADIGPRLSTKTVLPGMGFPLWRWGGSLIFIMGICTGKTASLYWFRHVITLNWWLLTSLTQIYVSISQCLECPKLADGYDM